MAEMSKRLQNKIEDKYKFLSSEVKGETQIRIETFKKLNGHINKEIPDFLNDLKDYKNDCSGQKNFVNSKIKEETLK